MAAATYLMEGICAPGQEEVMKDNLAAFFRANLDNFVAPHPGCPGDIYFRVPLALAEERVSFDFESKPLPERA